VQHQFEHNTWELYVFYQLVYQNKFLTYDFKLVPSKNARVIAHNSANEKLQTAS